MRKGFKRGDSISSLADIYCEKKCSERWKRTLFHRELEHKFGHHLTLKKRIRRKGWYASRRLPPGIIELIKERLGEPERSKS